MSLVSTSGVPHLFSLIGSRAFLMSSLYRPEPKAEMM